MSDFENTKLNIPALVAGGCGVSDLRKLNVSPADIRRAGFTIDHMKIHLGVDRLKEAGFSLLDLHNAGFPLSEVAKKFPIEEILALKKYSLSELMNFLPPSQLRQVGGFTVNDFVNQLGCNSVTLLKQYGFSDEEIAASGLLTVSSSSSSTPPKPLSYQPPHAQSMNVGETWTARRTGDCSTFLDVTYSRVDSSTASQMLRHPHPDNGQRSSYPYDGSGKNCPRCGRLFILVEKYSSSDGMCGVESGTWICDHANCGMKKMERYEGYSSIF